MIYLEWLKDLEVPPSETQTRELTQAASRGEDILKILSREGIASKEEALTALSRHLKVPRLQLDGYEPAPEALALFNERQVRKLRILPLFLADERLFVAIDDPLDLRRLDHARDLARMNVEPVLASRLDLESAITRLYLTSDRINEMLDEMLSQAQPVSRSKQTDVKEDSDAPAVRLVNQILERGIRLGASDIHIEHLPDRPSLRYRIDGILHEFPGLAESFYEGVVSRIKILSNMNISEQRAPQDGRASVVIDDVRHDLRVSTLPQIHGEGVAIRVLNTGWEAELGDLGMPTRVLESFRKEVHKPNGLVLVTGPTGSGKTTTLYATLRELVTPKKKFISVEDPVENVISGVNQVQVEPEMGRDFARCLRAFLRHDPDVAMIGEIRDHESAEIAVRAAQTGHLILSTLHTNDAALAVTRLVDIGIPPYLVLSSLNVVLSQRLIRRLCPHCKKQATDVPQLPFELSKNAKIFEPVGCERCANIGYRGRLGVYEVLVVNEQMRQLREQRFEAQDLLEAAGPDNYVSLAESAKLRLEHGETSAAEVLVLLTGMS